MKAGDVTAVVCRFIQKGSNMATACVHRSSERAPDGAVKDRIIVPPSEFLSKLLHEVPPSQPKGLPVWNGRAFVLDKPDAASAAKFTYTSGENMVGQTETPCASTTRLIGSRHRFVNAPDNSKEGYLWRPGNRYTNRVSSQPLIHASFAKARLRSCRW